MRVPLVSCMYLYQLTGWTCSLVYSILWPRCTSSMFAKLASVKYRMNVYVLIWQEVVRLGVYGLPRSEVGQLSFIVPLY